MKTLMVSSKGTATTGGSTTVYVIIGNNFTYNTGSEAFTQQTFRTPGILSNLAVRMTTNDRAQSTMVLRINAANGNGLVTISASTTGYFEDTSNFDEIKSGDKVNAAITTGAGGTTTTFQAVAASYSANQNTIQRAGLGGGNVVSGAVTRYYGWGIISSSTTEADNQLKMKTAATFKNLNVYVSANTKADATTIKTRVNNADGTLTFQIPSSTTGVFEDNSNTDTVKIDDLTCFQLVSGGGANSLQVEFITCEMETNNYTHLVSGQAGGVLQNANLNRYYSISGSLSGGNTLESTFQVEANVQFIASNLQAWVVANSVTANTTIRYRKNGGYGNQIVTIGSTATGYFEDTSNKDETLASDILTWEVLTGATGTSIRFNQVSVLCDLDIRRRVRLGRTR